MNVNECFAYDDAYGSEYMFVPDYYDYSQYPEYSNDYPDHPYPEYDPSLEQQLPIALDEPQPLPTSTQSEPDFRIVAKSPKLK